MAQTSSGTFMASRHAARAVSRRRDRRRRSAHAPPGRHPRLGAPAADPATVGQTRRVVRLHVDDVGMPVAARRAAPHPPPIRPALIALVTMLSASPRAGRARARVSAAASRSSRLVTHSTPARRSAASKARSAAPLGSASRLPGRIATTGRSRDAARAADRKARRSRNCLMSSRIAPVPGSRDSQSSTRPKPISARPPMPTIWLNPTPFGCAQSSTVRHSDADCDTSPSRPAGTGRCAREAFSPMPGTAMPNDSGPSTRTPARRAGSDRPSAAHRTMAANVPWRPAPAGDPVSAVYRRLPGPGRMAARRLPQAYQPPLCCP